MPERPAPTREEVLAYLREHRNWGRWGEDDERGTINLITPEKRRRAAQLVTEGITISCARPISYVTTPDQPKPSRRFMLSSAEAHAHSDNPVGYAEDAF